MRTRSVIVAGMHRSGTSFLGRLLHLAGIDMGEDLLGPNESNPHGHFEDTALLELQRDILRRENRGEDQWVLRPPKITAEDKARAHAYVEGRRRASAQGVVWGWKEPRTCMFLDLWAELLPGAYFLFPFRRPGL